jgi:hypothetical protein
VSCPSCGFENPTCFKFYGACGTPLIGLSHAPQTISTDELSGSLAAQTTRLTPPAAERRQLTVLFCDLVDSTALAIQLDPEELREVVQAYQSACVEIIQRFEGYIAQYLGDGLLVYVGYPQAHEDDGQHAVRAALGMVEAMGRLNQHLVQTLKERLAGEQYTQLEYRCSAYHLSPNLPPTLGSPRAPRPSHPEPLTSPPGGAHDRAGSMGQDVTG